MAEIETFLSEVSGFVWGPVMLALLLGTGVYLTVGLRFIPVRKLAYAVGLLVSGRRDHGRAKARGEISPFQALMVAVSGQVGTGNIAGVATAIFFGGPGAIFWMWITALVGMATQYSEALLAVHYRSRTEEGHYVGGPMHYIQKGLHRRWHWLAPLFALFGTVAAFGIGNAVQANSVAHVFEEWLTVPRAATGLALAAVVFVVVVGGVKRIAHWAEALVPTMAGVYIVGALAILVLNAAAIPEAVAGIFRAAFTGEAAAGGAAGGGVWLAIRFG
ncbi:MAG: amino acid carrier protein, partial [Alphaproteobacteria bacterium]